MAVSYNLFSKDSYEHSSFVVYVAQNPENDKLYAV